ncbi:MAG: hypothetical protein E4H36_07060 [Spirochaetales bacterium]|nr:MAG: hypothetical protein E4H36_07060 [Spirochaetales bacterium]
MKLALCSLLTMNGEQQKASAFINRLLSNPAMQGLIPLQKEEQIFQFLLQNSQQLYPTLSSANFFPQHTWEQILNLLCAALVEEINKTLLPNLQTIINEKTDLSFIPFLRQQNIPYQKIKEQMYEFLAQLLQKPEARKGFAGSYTALAFNFSEKYIAQLVTRKEYAHFELVKVQRLRMGKEELKDMINVSMLLKPAIYSLTPTGGTTPSDSTSGTVQSQFAEKIFQAAKAQLSYLPEEVIKSAVNSNVSFTENRFLEATSRIAALFANRCKTYAPQAKVDRGADTPDKSWFNIARRNFKFYGYDVKMLDEFFKIAAENSW